MRPWRWWEFCYAYGDPCIVRAPQLRVFRWLAVLRFVVPLLLVVGYRLLDARSRVVAGAIIATSVALVVATWIAAWLGRRAYDRRLR